MAKLGINTGSTPNDGTGDTLLAAALKINQNFDEIYNVFGDGTNIEPNNWTQSGSGIHTISKVGIGTTNPTSNLTVKGSTSLENLSVSGVSTLSSVVVGGATTQLVVNGDARITGILTIGTSSITIDGLSNALRVGQNATIDSYGNVYFAGIGTFGSGLINMGPVGGAYYYEQFSVNDGLPITIQTRVSTKTTVNRYFGIGSMSSYYLDDIEAPFLSLIPGKIYIFNQEDQSNETYQISFYTDESRNNPYIDGVTIAGVAGSTGSYTELIISENTPSILYYEGGDFIGGQIQVVGASIYSVEGKWSVGAAGTSSFTFTGIGFTQTTNDPVLYLARGKIYEFINNSGNPFEIRISNGGGAYNNGVSNNSASSGTIRFEIPMNAPNTLYYQSTSNAGMGNTISVYPSLI